MQKQHNDLYRKGLGHPAICLSLAIQRHRVIGKNQCNIDAFRHPKPQTAVFIRRPCSTHSVESPARWRNCMFCRRPPTFWPACSPTHRSSNSPTVFMFQRITITPPSIHWFYFYMAPARWVTTIFRNFRFSLMAWFLSPTRIRCAIGRCLWHPNVPAPIFGPTARWRSNCRHFWTS